MAKKDRDASTPGGGSSLGDLFGALGLRSSTPDPAPAPTPSPPKGKQVKASPPKPSAPTPSAPKPSMPKPSVPKVALPPGTPDLSGKLVLRRSKKGRGGKTATLVQGVGGGPEALESLARTLKKQLGCGATVDGEDVLVQGDQGDRIETILAGMGAGRIVRG